MEDIMKVYQIIQEEAEIILERLMLVNLLNSD